MGHWMTAECFFAYIINVYHPFLLKEETPLPFVFIDGHATHFSIELSEFCSKNGIILVALFPNVTHIFQPFDAVVFGPMKAKWKSFWRQFYLMTYNRIMKIYHQAVENVHIKADVQMVDCNTTAVTEPETACFSLKNKNRKSNQNVLI